MEFCIGGVCSELEFGNILEMDLEMGYGVVVGVGGRMEFHSDEKTKNMIGVVIREYSRVGGRKLCPLTIFLTQKFFYYGSGVDSLEA